MRKLLILIMMLFCIKAKSQIGDGKLCINLKQEIKLNKSVKIFVKKDIYKDDTITYLSHIENGMPINTEISNNIKYEYKFDTNNNLLSLKEIHFDNVKKPKEEVCHTCVYDSKERLIKYIYNEKSLDKEEREFEDKIFYSNNDDTIKYIGTFYSIITSKVKKENEIILTISDTLGNLQRIEKIYDSRKIFSRNFKNGKEGLGTYYLYNEKGLLKSVIREDRDDMDYMILIGYTNYLYDDDNRLREERNYFGNSELNSIKTIWYNEKGLIEKEVEEYENDNNQRIYLYSYEYW